MATSKRGAPTRNLVAFCGWLARNGYQVGEMPPWGTVHPVHVANSFHYDRDGKYGQAADINWPGGGDTEHNRLAAAVAVAESMGLGVIFALHGTKGAASSHKTHLHADVGLWSSLGRGDFTRKAGDLVVWDTQLAAHASQDNRDGPITTKHLEAIKAASNRHGVKFPYGVEFAQEAVGAAQDGDWGDHSRYSHDTTVNHLEHVWKPAGLYTKGFDTIWGAGMDAALARFTKKYRQ